MFLVAFDALRSYGTRLLHVSLYFNKKLSDKLILGISPSMFGTVLDQKVFEALVARSASGIASCQLRH